jgi:UrcA family protein
MSMFRRAPLALFGLVLIAPSLAAEPGTETISIRVGRPASPSPAATRRLERRIASAALEACGASPYSAPELKDAVAHSACWRDSYAGGIAQIGRAAPKDVAALSPSPSLGTP